METPFHQATGDDIRGRWTHAQDREVAEGLGCRGVRIEKQEELVPALRDLGFQIRFEPHHGGVDPRVPKLFPGVDDWNAPTDSGIAPIVAVEIA